MPQLVQATCPGCQAKLRIPSQWLNGLLRCKQCGQAFRATHSLASEPFLPAMTPAAVSHTNVFAEGFSDFGADETEEDDLLLRRYERRRRQRQSMRTAVAIFLLLAVTAGLGYAGWRWSPELKEALARFRNVLGREEPLVVQRRPPPPEDDAPPVEPKSVAPQIQHPRRALLVGIKNYLYVNPSTPSRAGEPDKDPLQLQKFRLALLSFLKYRGDQVGELSDRPGGGALPLQEVVRATITDFLANSRPQDRVLLLFTGYAAAIKGTNYLVPLEGDLERPESLIPLDWLVAELGKCKSRQRLAILDVIHLDAEKGMTQVTPAAVSPQFVKALQAAPEGVQIWLSGAAGQIPQLHGDSDASLFMSYLLQVVNELGRAETRGPLASRLGLPNGKWVDAPEDPIPLVRLAPEINRETAQAAKERFAAMQTPQLFGKEAPGPDPALNDPPAPAVAIKIPQANEQRVDPQWVNSVLDELKLAEFRRFQSYFNGLPAKTAEPYRQDVPPTSPMRKATEASLTRLAKPSYDLPMFFSYASDDAAFKKQVRERQELPARLFEELRNLADEMEKANEDRDKSPSKRWQAHYDYALARLLGEMIRVQEYNYVLGKMRQTAPPRKNPKSDGWNLVPHEKLTQKETRELEKKRQQTIGRLLKENPATLWAALARREQFLMFGLIPQESQPANW